MGLAIGIGVAVLVVIGAVGFFVVRRQRSSVEKRLDEFTGQAVAPTAKPEAAESGPKTSLIANSLDKMLTGRSFADNIATELRRADLKFTVAEYLALHVILAMGLGGAAFILNGGLIWAFIAAAAGLFIPRFYVGSQKSGRLAKFDGQLGDMLNLCVNGLRAGYSVMQALESVAKELPPPISSEFKRVVQEMQLGVPMEQALANLTSRIPSKDLDFVVTAINVQREVGGNLAEILDTITFTIRERVRIKGEIATLTAQGMMTGYVIAGLPIALGLFLLLINPSYIGRLWAVGKFQFCGIGMIVTVVLLIVIGFSIIMKIVNIEI